MDPQQMINQIMNAKFCGDVFVRDENQIRSDYRNYARAIHPDICSLPDSKQAFEKLNKLHEEALNCIQDGTWFESNILRIPHMSPIHYLNDIFTEFGARYITDSKVIWMFDPDKIKHKKNFLLMKSKIRFANQKMLDIYKRKIPITWQYDSSGNGRELFVEKYPNEYPMDLFLSAYADQLTGRDIAWMVSRMCDLLCFLEYNKIVLNGFDPENLFINPTAHSIAIYGGWQYAAIAGEKMIGTTKHIYNLMPTSVRTSGLASHETDIECVRDIVRGMISKAKGDIPKPIQDWVEFGSVSEPVKEYSRWIKALDKAYGPRKFVKFEVDPNKIYLQK